jgi:signal transduction histidine kinase
VGYGVEEERVDWLRRLSKNKKELSKDRAKEVEEREEQLALANALSRIVLSSSDLNELCKGFVDELRELVPIDWAAIALIDSFMDVLRLSPLSAKISSNWELGDTIPLADTPVAWLAKSQQAILECDLKRESRFGTGASFLKQGIRTIVYMPLFSCKEVFGGFIVGSHCPNAYGERELKLLKYATTQLALAIENYRLLQENREGIKQRAEFIAALTHELKTPLTPIRASGELLAEELQKDPQTPRAKLAENIVRSAYTLDSKLSEMLELAKAQSPTFALQLKRLDIKSLLDKVVTQLRPIAQSKGQPLNMELPLPLPPVKADMQQLERVLLNLLSNAIKFTPPGGSITLRVRKQDSELVIMVQDSGAGFSPEKLKNLFKTCYYAEPERQRAVEPRLDLSKRLVELHKGRMWAESKVGKGSTFAFSLPLD